MKVKKNTNKVSELFIQHINDIMDKLKTRKQPCHWMGDYNINLFSAERHIQTSNFVDLMYSNSFFPLINKPTRVTARSATLIDNIFANKPNLECSFQCILVTDISDHLPIIFIDCNKHQQNSCEFISRRSMSTKVERCI